VWAGRCPLPAVCCALCAGRQEELSTGWAVWVVRQCLRRRSGSLPPCIKGVLRYELGCVCCSDKWRGGDGESKQCAAGLEGP
jgi:hypothetical protein